MYDISIKIKNYKCFKDESGFDFIKRVNIIIGRNNSGKSSLIDLVEHVTKGAYSFDGATWHGNQPPEIVYKSIIPKRAVERTFPGNVSDGPIRGHHAEYGKKFIGREITWSKSGEGASQSRLVRCDNEGITPPLNTTGYAGSLVSSMPVALEGKTFKRVAAERDINQEVDNRGSINIESNGRGITNAIQCFINSSKLPSDIVEVKMLDALNAIFAHDACFTDIVCQLHDTNLWEIYLEEKHKGRVPLSRSGSGIKTVIAILASIFIVPSIDGKPLSDYVFAFEEIENNIHPALLRRLADYLYKQSIENDFLFFLTTHSSVLIDQFSKQDDAQIIHVTHSDGISTCGTVKAYIEKRGILDDLDVRASDLLQANGVIWVEGPSDRIYLNRWIYLWSNGEFKEGTHYQIMFYGGRLLSHLSADDPEDIESSIALLKINRNAVMLIDSDKRAQGSKVNDTKQRIKSEFNKIGAMCWITKGREIENYIPPNVIGEVLKLNISTPLEPFSSFFDWLDNIKKGVGEKYRDKKPLLAELLVEYMDKSNMSTIFDIDERMVELCKHISAWNK